MTAGTPLIGGTRCLRALDERRAAVLRGEIAELARDAGSERLAFWLEGDGEEADGFVAILELSPYLAGLVERRPDWIEQLFHRSAADRFEEILRELDAPVPEGLAESAAMSGLRRLKGEAALLIALRDLAGAADGRQTTTDLSRLADAAIRRAVRFALLDLHRRGRLRLPDPADPERGAGLAVLGLGKLGGGELNYSSDVDLILFFDPEAPAVLDPAESVDTFSRLARLLVRLLAERTRDGYVFRTDLRLRPDPSAMPLAIPLPTALVYYESAGRDWERAAMIKARTVAGDPAVGEEFLGAIAPFVWRRYLDFAAIRDIRAMKDRMDRHRGFGGMAVAGHNVKLGRGGIREIEFFAQTQQLIAGGRAPELRLRKTVETLRTLARGGWIEEETAGELVEAYWFLRDVEHVLQMIGDEQTHSLPESERELERVARLLGFEGRESFSRALLARLRTVSQRFAELFADGARDPGEDSAPVLAALGDAEDEAAIAWLAAEGFARPRDIARMLAGWGAGRYRALRSEGARERMALVLPRLVSAFAVAREPDAAMMAFDRFLAGLPAGLQFFALIQSNPKLLELLALVITGAPGLAETIARRPHVFDALLDPAFFGEMPDRDAMRERLEPLLAEAEGYEETLARLRLFAAEQRFLIGVRLLSGAVEGEDAGESYSDLAEMVIEALLAATEREFANLHGAVRGGRIALLALGRLGSRELTATSDVDLILVYHHDDAAEQSDGRRPLPVSTYYARLTQRLIAGLTAPMGEGILYAVDFRLRPSGNKGPLATEIESFRRYQDREAWTWEHMALTRSRTVAGDGELRDEVAALAQSVVARGRDPAALTRDVASMRARIEREKPPRGPLDLKLRAGGIVDLEFIAQWAILANRVPRSLVGAPTLEVLEALESGGERSGALCDAMLLFTRTVHLLRLGADGVYRVEDLPRGLAERIAAAIGADGVQEVESVLDEHAARVRRRFAEILPAPEGEPDADPLG